MSVPLRRAAIICVTVLLSAAASAAARAETPAQAVGPALHRQFAQRDVASCRSWASQIQSMRNNYNAQCSGSLPPHQVARCNDMRQQLQNEIQRYNAACGG